MLPAHSPTSSSHMPARRDTSAATTDVIRTGSSDHGTVQSMKGATVTPGDSIGNADLERKKRKRKRAWYFLSVISLAVGGGLVLTTTAESAPPPDMAFEPLGRDGEKTFSVQVGSVIAQGTQEGDRCIFDEPFGVGGTISGAGPSPIIRWRIDEQCRAVVSEIRDPAPSAPQTPAQTPPANGDSQAPQLSTSAEEGE